MGGRGKKSVGLGNRYEPTEKEKTTFVKYFNERGELLKDELSTEERTELATLIPGCSRELLDIVGKALEPEEEPDLPLVLRLETPEVSLADAFYVWNKRDMYFDRIADSDSVTEKERKKLYKDLKTSFTNAIRFVHHFWKNVPYEEEAEKENKRVKLD
jgi:hypothetical protein